MIVKLKECQALQETIRPTGRTLSEMAVYSAFRDYPSVKNSRMSASYLLAFPRDRGGYVRTHNLLNYRPHIVPDANRQGDDLGKPELQGNEHTHVALQYQTNMSSRFLGKVARQPVCGTGMYVYLNYVINSDFCLSFPFTHTRTAPSAYLPYALDGLHGPLRIDNVESEIQLARQQLFGADLRRARRKASRETGKGITGLLYDVLKKYHVSGPLSFIQFILSSGRRLEGDKEILLLPCHFSF